MQVTDYYDNQSLIWLGSVTFLHDYSSTNPDIWINHTITRELTDIDYTGEDPHEDDYDDFKPYDIWEDPMLWVAVGVVGGIAFGVGIFIHVTRKRAREWQLAEIQKFEADRAAQSGPPQDGESI